ncbi:MAG: phosphodiester glycosidase family protein [Oscillospiraceae bacterium]|nr:phosphodiester glycosidase family protein [Oscillospiraceae bacterium]
MKKFTTKKKSPAKLIMVYLLLSALLSASAAELGSKIEIKDSVFQIGTSPENEHYFLYEPHSDVRPVVMYGSKVCNYGKFSSMAQVLTNKGWNVVGGINGGFYNTGSYQPLGLLVSEGIMMSSDEVDYHAIGFRDDGTAFIGDPEMELSIEINRREYTLRGYNKSRDRKGFYLLSSDFFKDTQNTEPGRDIILTPEFSGGVTVNGSFEFSVERVVYSTQPLEIPEGKYVLTINNYADESLQTVTDGIARGDTITLRVSSNREWSGAESAVGSYVKLVTRGQIDTEYAKSPKFDETHPRTAIGIKSDGTVVMYTVDGRQSAISDGLTAEQTARRLIELGCREALMLDGGGSSNFQVQYIGNDYFTQLNHPSDYAGANGGGKERSVTNYIALAAPELGSGIARYLSLYPQDAKVLKGSDFRFEVRASDETLRPVDASESEIDHSGNRYIAYFEGLTAEASLTEIENPDYFLLRLDGVGINALNLYRGVSYDVNAASFYQGDELFSTDNAYAWSLTPELGTVDANGVVTITAESGDGELAVTVGNQRIVIPVTIARSIIALETFEGHFSGYIAGENGSTAAIEQETDMDFVKFGRAAAKISGAGYIPLEYSIDEELGYATMWVYTPEGKQGGSVTLHYADGSEFTAAIPESDIWTRLVFDLPALGTDITGITIEGSGGTRDCELYIDQITAASDRDIDETPPAISDIVIDPELPAMTATINDNITDLSGDGILVTLDGEAQEFSYRPQTGELTAALPALNGGQHKATIIATDSGGNISRRSLMFFAPYSEDEETGDKFTDMGEHWAYDYVDYMADLGVVNGIESAAGKFEYQPNAPITRAQFAVMLYRFLGGENADELIADSASSDGSLIFEPYSVTSVFDDANDIPDWAADAVAYVVGMGYIKGVGGDDGLYFQPNGTLTRAQAMTILGRIQPYGYPLAELVNFKDYADIPDWSLRYVASLVGQEVINGREGNLLAPNDALTRAEVAKILTELA